MKYNLFRKLKEIIHRNHSDNSTKSIWDNSMEQYQKGQFKIYWELLTEVSKYQNSGMSRDPNTYGLTYAFDYVRKKVGNKNLKGLSIGCNEAGPEMDIFNEGLFSEIKVMDIAEGLLNKQRKIALEKGLKGIDYVKQDLNKVVLEKNSYDVIWAIGIVHHIEYLETFLDETNNALKENGIFIIREYIGPNRLQFTDIQLNIVNEILSILPEKYKIQADGNIKNIVKSPDIAELIKNDPSESIRSEDIMPLLKEKFEIIKLAYTGGTILQPLLSYIASNFERDQDGVTILKLLILFEKILIEKEVLSSDYVFCIVKKRLDNVGYK